jgi:hypothetical protein
MSTPGNVERHGVALGVLLWEKHSLTRNTPAPEACFLDRVLTSALCALLLRTNMLYVFLRCHSSGESICTRRLLPSLASRPLNFQLIFFRKVMLTLVHAQSEMYMLSDRLTSPCPETHGHPSIGGSSIPPKPARVHFANIQLTQ